MKVLVSCLVVLLACLCSAEEENARILVSKSILNELIVEGKDLTVEYNIFNVGGSAALDVQLNDGGFASEYFEVAAGSLNAKWSRLSPGSNVTHVAVVQALQSGYFNFTSAEVSYQPSEGAERVFGYSSAPGEGGIMSYSEYDRRFSSHVVDWAAFAVMTLPSLGIPFLLWHSSKSKYEGYAKPKKN